jgi:hypothetical protein
MMDILLLKISITLLLRKVINDLQKTIGIYFKIIKLYQFLFIDNNSTTFPLVVFSILYSLQYINQFIYFYSNFMVILWL